MPNTKNLRNSESGLTIIEILVSLVILTSMVTLSMFPLSGFFNNIKESRVDLDTASKAREIMELAIAQWQDFPYVDPATTANPESTSEKNQKISDQNTKNLNQYNKNCFDLTTLNYINDSYVNLTLQQINRKGELIKELPLVKTGNCQDIQAGPNIPLKRLVVSVTNSQSKETIIFNIDIPIPSPIIPVDHIGKKYLEPGDEGL